MKILPPLTLAALACAHVLPSVQAIDPGLIKYVGLPNGSATVNVGTAIAASDKWVLIGDPLYGGGSPAVGALHVLDATTGIEVRTLLEPANVYNLGLSCAVSGDFAVVAASGTVNVYSLTTGKRLHTLIPSDALVSNDNFGQAVAATGNYAIVTATGADGAAVNSGKAYVFDLTTGFQISTMMATNGAANDYLGSAVAAVGRFAVLGAATVSHPTSQTGAAYVFDLVTGQQLWQLSPSAATANLKFGSAVAIRGNRVCVGATGDSADKGSVYLYDATTGAMERKLTASDGLAGELFGSSVALGENALIVGAPDHKNPELRGACYAFDPASGEELQRFTPNDVANNSYFGLTLAASGNVVVMGAPYAHFYDGAVYITHGFTAALPLAIVATKGDFVPGAPGTTISSFDEAVVNWQDETLFTATLIGPGSLGGKAKGLWSEQSGSTQGLLRLGDYAGAGVKIAAASNPILNDPTTAVLRIKLSGTGISAANDERIYSHDGSALTLVRGKGNIGFGQLTKLLEVTQNFNFFFPRIAITEQYAIGPNGITATSDSRIETITPALASTIVQEGNSSVSIAGTQFGQFSPRVAFTNLDYAWSCALQGSPTATNAAVFKVTASDAMHVDTVIAKKGFSAPGAGGGLFATFLGESISGSGSVTIHATLSGAGVTSAANEGLWSTRSGSLAAVAMEGQQAPTLATNVVFATFPQFWASGLAPDHVLFLAKLRGPGITAANDMALWLSNESGQLSLLLREGDAAPGGNDGARIGSITRVEVEPISGVYAILTPLVGGAKGKDLALWTGQTSVGNATTLQALRSPHLALRKGTHYKATLGNVSQLQSIALPAHSQDSTGAGCKGLAQSIHRSGGVAVILTFDDGSVVLANGKP